jgi:peptide/nickel transport system ATP-binding protein
VTEPVAALTDFSLSLVRNGIRSQVLEHIDLQIWPGEILGLVGESGSGKSVLALSLLGLLPGTSHPQADGQVTVSGVDMVRASAAELRRVRAEVLGAIFQDPMTSLNPTMRIGRQIGEVTHAEAKSVRLLETVGVRDAQLRLRVYPHELSGGLRQRVMAAIAVGNRGERSDGESTRGERSDGESTRPGLIVADEPTTALDVTVQAQLLELLRELRDEFGCSVLLITHDLGVADKIADRLAVLHRGELVEIGQASDVVRNPQHDYTRSLLASRLSLTMPRDERFGGDTHGSEPAVSISNLRRTFLVRRGARWGRGRSREINAVDGVDLDIAPGEALAIVGESGSGKSTLLRIVAGLEKPTSGSVTLAGTGGPQMVFQDAGSSLTPWMTVGETLGERLRPLKLSRAEVGERVTAALAAVDLPPEVAKAHPGELSGGQRQRVVLARATMIPPAVLLCDEPTSALDASLAKSVLALIRDLRARIGMTVLFVTHDLAVARLMGDRIAVMQAGRVVELGPAEQVIAEPREPYTRTLLAAVPEIVGGAVS